MSGFSAQELLGKPHSVIRHPDMPRGVFRFLWQRIQAESEIFALVVNLSRNGDHYWVLAHVTPTFGLHHEIVGYHSNRRCPDARAVQAIQPLYQEMRILEEGIANPKVAAEQSQALLESRLQKMGLEYDEFIFDLLKKCSEA